MGAEHPPIECVRDDLCEKIVGLCRVPFCLFVSVLTTVLSLLACYSSVAEAFR